MNGANLNIFQSSLDDKVDSFEDLLNEPNLVPNSQYRTFRELFVQRSPISQKKTKKLLFSEKTVSKTKTDLNVTHSGTPNSKPLGDIKTDNLLKLPLDLFSS